MLAIILTTILFLSSSIIVQTFSDKHINITYKQNIPIESNEYFENYCNLQTTEKKKSINQSFYQSFSFQLFETIEKNTITKNEIRIIHDFRLSFKKIAIITKVKKRKKSNVYYFMEGN